MNNIYAPLLLLAGLTLTTCSNKDKDNGPNPANTIPGNSAALKVDGVPYPVDITYTKAVIDINTGVLRVNISSNDRQGPFVYMEILEFRKRAEKINFLPASTSGFTLAAGQRSGGGDYSTQACKSRECDLEIVEVNEDRKTVSVKFSGTVCGGATSKKVTEGQFNLPYTIR